MRGQSRGRRLNAGLHVRVHGGIHASRPAGWWGGNPRYTRGRGVGKRGGLPRKVWANVTVSIAVGVGDESGACLSFDPPSRSKTPFRRWHTPRKQL
jgi:hypothetical protein